MAESEGAVATATTRYNPRLDGVRTVAIGLVMLSHYGLAFAPYLPGGNVGVRIFFVLSGFLITGILVDVRNRAEAVGQRVTITLRQFYARRALRIFPCYFLAIGIALAANLSNARELWPWLVTFTGNWYMALTGGGMGHLSPYWSIAVEEQFYLLWPWLLLLLPARKLPWLYPVAITASVATRLFGGFLGLHEMFLYTSTLTAIDALALGGWMATTERIKGLRTFSLWAGVGGSLILYAAKVANGLSGIPLQLYEMSSAILGAWLILEAVEPRGFVGKMLALKPAVYLGRISYGIYAYHMLIYGLTGMLLLRLGISWDRNEIARIIGMTFASFAFAALSFHLYENPINQFKTRFPYVVNPTRPTNGLAMRDEIQAGKLPGLQQRPEQRRGAPEEHPPEAVERPRGSVDDQANDPAVV